MGVLPCNRNGCENIMCDYHSDEYGYLCWECYNELIEKGPTSFATFMNSPKDSCVDYRNTFWKEHVEKEFKDRYQ